MFNVPKCNVSPWLWCIEFYFLAGGSIYLTNRWRIEGEIFIVLIQDFKYYTLLEIVNKSFFFCLESKKQSARLYVGWPPTTYLRNLPLESCFQCLSNLCAPSVIKFFSILFNSLEYNHLIFALALHNAHHPFNFIIILKRQ